MDCSTEILVKYFLTETIILNDSVFHMHPSHSSFFTFHPYYMKVVVNNLVFVYIVQHLKSEALTQCLP